MYSFADWLNNQNVRNELKLEIKICLVQNGYPPQYSSEVFGKVMEQVENFEENVCYDDVEVKVQENDSGYPIYEADENLMVAEDAAMSGENNKK